MSWFHSALAHGIARCALPVQNTFTLQRPILGRSCQPAPHPLLSQRPAPAHRVRAAAQFSPRTSAAPAASPQAAAASTCCSAAAAEASPAACVRAPAVSDTPSRGCPYLHRPGSGRHLAAHGEEPEGQLGAPPAATNAGMGGPCQWAGPARWAGPVGGRGRSGGLACQTRRFTVT